MDLFDLGDICFCLADSAKNLEEKRKGHFENLKHRRQLFMIPERVKFSFDRRKLLRNLEVVFSKLYAIFLLAQSAKARNQI